MCTELARPTATASPPEWNSQAPIQPTELFSTLKKSSCTSAASSSSLLSPLTDSSPDNRNHGQEEKEQVRTPPPAEHTTSWSSIVAIVAVIDVVARALARSRDSTSRRCWTNTPTLDPLTGHLSPREPRADHLPAAATRRAAATSSPSAAATARAARPRTRPSRGSPSATWSSLPLFVRSLSFGPRAPIQFTSEPPANTSQVTSPMPRSSPSTRFPRCT